MPFVTYTASGSHRIQKRLSSGVQVPISLFLQKNKEPTKADSLFWCRRRDLKGNALHARMLANPIVFGFAEGVQVPHNFLFTKNDRNLKNRFLPFWCERRDLNPYGITTRPSNVRVCRFRHSRICFCSLGTLFIIAKQNENVKPFFKKIKYF